MATARLVEPEPVEPVVTLTLSKSEAIALKKFLAVTPENAPTDSAFMALFDLQLDA